VATDSAGLVGPNNTAGISTIRRIFRFRRGTRSRSQGVPARLCADRLGAPRLAATWRYPARRLRRSIRVIRST
jgi:hypothetical protein